MLVECFLIAFPIRLHCTFSDAVLLRVLLACVTEDAHILGCENGSVELNKMIK
jgi:hypothetical protein